MNLVDVIKQHKKNLLISDGGAGKSTSLIWSFSELLDDKTIVPIFVPIKQCSTYGCISNFIKIKYLSDSSLNNAELSFLFENLPHIKFVLIIDGLNEIPADDKWDYYDEVEKLSNAKNVSIVISMRSAEDKMFPEFVRYKLKSIDDETVYEITKKQEHSEKTMQLLKSPYFITKYVGNDFVTPMKMLKNFYDNMVERIVQYDHKLYKKTKIVIDDFLPIMCAVFVSSNLLLISEKEMVKCFKSCECHSNYSYPELINEFIYILADLGIVNLIYYKEKGMYIQFHMKTRDYFAAVYTIKHLCNENEIETSNGSVIEYICAENEWSYAKLNIQGEVVFNNAFENCAFLREVRMSESVEGIGKKAFYNCKNINKITLPSNMEIICKGAFWKCEGLSFINLPRKIKFIESMAFAQCSELLGIKIPHNVEVIFPGLFFGCKKLAVVLFMGRVKVIEKGAFQGCSNLMFVNLPSSIEHIDEEAFSFSGLDKIRLPKIKKISSYMFSFCVLLEKVKIRRGTIEIADRAFHFCKNLKKVNIPKTIRQIGDYAFHGCESLEKIKIPASVESIGENVFKDCDNLTLYCEAGSYAEKYAIENRLKYKLIKRFLLL